MLIHSLLLMGYGLAGVFISLGIFAALTAVMRKIFPYKEKESEKEKEE